MDTREDRRLALVSVGDSRLYRVRDGALEQLTEDPQPGGLPRRQGHLTADEAESHPQRNILTQALGIDRAVSSTPGTSRPVLGDRYLTVSDGLFKRGGRPPASATSAGCRARRGRPRAGPPGQRGRGWDNITCVVVDVSEGKSGLLGRRKSAEPGRVEDWLRARPGRRLEYFGVEDGNGEKPAKTREKRPRRPRTPGNSCSFWRCSW